MGRRKSNEDSTPSIAAELITPPQPPPLTTARRRRRGDDEPADEPLLELDERVTLRNLDQCATVLEATANALSDGRIGEKEARAFTTITMAAASLIDMKRRHSAKATDGPAESPEALSHEVAAAGPFAFDVLEGGR